MVTAFQSMFVVHPTCSPFRDFNCSVLQSDSVGSLPSSKKLIHRRPNCHPNNNEYHYQKEKRIHSNGFALARLTTSSTSDEEKKRTGKDASFQSTGDVSSATNLSSPSGVGKEQTRLLEQGKTPTIPLS